MNEGEERGQDRPLRAAAPKSRADRLAAALRANLAKRKQQGRARVRRGEQEAGGDQPGIRNAQPADGAAFASPPEPLPHDSAEIIPEKSTSQSD